MPPSNVTSKTIKRIIMLSETYFYINTRHPLKYRLARPKPTEKLFSTLILTAASAFSFDRLAATVGKTVCIIAAKLDANYILRLMNHCLDPIAIGYWALFIGFCLVTGSGFFVWWDE